MLWVPGGERGGQPGDERDVGACGRALRDVGGRCHDDRAMGIRDALTDDYLARFYDPGTLARARACLDGVVELEAVHETSSSLTVTAEVWGTAPTPTRVQFHAEVNETSDWVFSACSCPVARMCKHGAAVALRLRGAPPVPSQPLWQQRLARLSSELDRRARSTLAGTPLGLEVSRRPASRWSRGTPGDFTLRPVRPGARQGWARSGAEWPRPLRTRGLGPLRAGAGRGPAGAAARAGQHARLPRVGLGAPARRLRRPPGAGAACGRGRRRHPGARRGRRPLSLSSRPARWRPTSSAGHRHGALEVLAEVDDRRWRGDLVTPVGRPATSLVLVEGDDVLLADLAEPLADALAELLVGPPLVVDADDLDPFLEALAPLARHVEVASSDGSLEVPAPPRPRLHVTVTWHSSTHAALAWQWAYGDARCDASSPESLGGVRDPAAERAVLATVADHLVGPHLGLGRRRAVPGPARPPPPRHAARRHGGGGRGPRLPGVGERPGDRVHPGRAAARPHRLARPRGAGQRRRRAGPAARRARGA